MKKRRGKIFGIVAVITLSLVIPIVILVNLIDLDTLSYQANWGIEFPHSLKLKYEESNTAGGMGGDGQVYSVFQTKGPSADFLSDFSSEKNPEFEEKLNRIVGEWLQISAEWTPDWDKPYQWRLLEEYGNYLCMFYQPDTQELIVAAWYQ